MALVADPIVREHSWHDSKGVVLEGVQQQRWWDRPERDALSDCILGGARDSLEKAEFQKMRWQQEQRAPVSASVSLYAQ